MFRLFGYAGSGKTTLAKHLADTSDDVQRVAYLAYTGKAAHVLASKGCHGATTIHRQIYLQAGTVTAEQIEAQRERLAGLRKAADADPNDATAAELAQQAADQLKRMEETAARKGPRFILNPASPIAEMDLIIVDECSMVDGRIGSDLLSFGVPVIALGDPAQLPPVGGGGFFTDHEPDVLLDEVHRQAEDSPILWLATKIRKRERFAHGTYGDCHVISYGPRDADVRERAAMSADQVLVGRNKTRHSCNHKIRRLRGLGEGGLPGAGDRVICLRNDHEQGLLNGSLWNVATSLGIDDETVALEVESVDGDGKVACTAWLHHFQGREDELSPFVKRDCQEFAYGYAITVHKSQGSQWDNVCVFDESPAFGQNAHRHLYTAVTRAAKRLTLVT